MTRLEKLQLIAGLVTFFIFAIFLSVIIGTVGIALMVVKFIAEQLSDLMELPVHIWNIATAKINTSTI